MNTNLCIPYHQLHTFTEQFADKPTRGQQIKNIMKILYYIYTLNVTLTLSNIGYRNNVFCP